MSAFQSSDETPAVVVYERPERVTTADIAAVAGQVEEFDDVDDVDRARVGPAAVRGQARRCR